MLTGFRVSAPPSATAELIDDTGQRYTVQFSPEVSTEMRGRSREFGSNSRSGLPEYLTVFADAFPKRFQLYRAGSGGGVGAASDGAITSPMPGRIIAVEVAAGASVAKGQKLVTLEAMKMEHTLTAPFDGVVAELNAAAGSQVAEGTLLVRVEAGKG
jgi:3-methylcrotonyl-CoA carboxylase alpha subunit